jgi:sulfur carrier protein ThiS
VIKVQSFDAAQNVGEDQSPGLLTIPDRQPPTAIFLTTFPQFLEIGDKLQMGWQAQDNAGIQSQRLALLVNGTPVPIAPNLDATVREFMFDTTTLEPGLRLQLALTLVDLNGIEATITTSTFDIKPKVTNIVLEKKSATLTGVGFKAGSTAVLVNGIAISSSVVTIESSTKITIKGKPKKQRITPGSLIGVLVNNTPSKEIVVR